MLFKGKGVALMPRGVYKHKKGRLVTSGSFKKGHKHSEETKRKISQINTGRILSQEARRNISIRSSGSKSHFWRGGKSFKFYPLGWTKTFREQIRYRDEYRCRGCGVPETEHKRRLSVHHIDLNKSNIKENNLISLCMSCHSILHKRKRRKVCV